MKIQWMSVLFAVVVGPLVHAQTLKVQTGTEKIDKVTLATSATSTDGAKLVPVGAGLRIKKIVFMNVKVYVAQLFVSDVTKFKRNPVDALKSLNDAAPVAIQLHFLRDADKVQGAFRDSLEINKVDFKKPEYEKVLAAVKSSGSAKDGKSLTIYGKKQGDGTEFITYEDVNGKITSIAGTAGFIQDVFSMWLGIPGDEGVEKMKADILK
jgi:hypothetical protein